jgi:hypothetical protein
LELELRPRFGKIPYRFNGEFRDSELAGLIETNFTIWHTVEWSAACHRIQEEALTVDLLSHSVLTREAEWKD